MVDPVKMVIAVRKDLDMGKGKIAGQVAHAAVECALKSEKYNKKIFKEWIDTNQKKVVIKVNGEEELEKLLELCRLNGFIYAEIHDAGYTQVEPGTFTCLGIGPAKSSELDPITGDFGLL
jgi:PTH2 family peptidyl-tRNA hydrolase